MSDSAERSPQPAAPVDPIVADPVPAQFGARTGTPADTVEESFPNPDALSAHYLAARADVRAGKLTVAEAAEKVRRAYAVDADGVRWGIGTDGRWWMLEPMRATAHDADPAVFAYHSATPTWTPAARPAATVATRPNNHLTLAMVAAVLFWPAGLVAVWNAAATWRALLDADSEKAVRASRNARLWGWIGVGVGGVGVAVTLTSLALMLSSLASMETIP